MSGSFPLFLLIVLIKLIFKMGFLMIMILFILLFYLQTFKDQNEKKNNYNILGESHIFNQKLDFIHENVINIQILDFSNLIYRKNMMVEQFFMNYLAEACWSHS